MNKTSKILIIAFIAISATACSSKYDVDTSYIPTEMRERQESMLESNLQLYDTADNPVGKANAAFEVGFNYMILGENGKAIKYYQEVIETDPVHFAALNNLSSIYETAGELDMALQYTQQLYNNEAYQETPEVIRDIVRLLLANGKGAEARKVLDKYATTEKGQKDGPFIEEQYSLIK